MIGNALGFAAVAVWVTLIARSEQPAFVAIRAQARRKFDELRASVTSSAQLVVDGERDSKFTVGDGE